MRFKITIHRKEKIEAYLEPLVSGIPDDDNKKVKRLPMTVVRYLDYISKLSVGTGAETDEVKKWRQRLWIDGKLKRTG